MVTAIVAFTTPVVAADVVVTRVDSLDRVFPDRTPEASPPTGHVSVPRNAWAPFQFALRSEGAGEVRLSVSPLRSSDGTALAGKVRLYELVAVPVEANNNGGSKTAIGVEPPEAWRPSFIRRAPFEVAEVLVETDRLALRPAETKALLADTHVSPEATPGLYSGALTAATGRQRVECPFSLRVHRTVAPSDPLLDVTFWFWPQPENLTNEAPPEWWGERHWRLIEESGRTLRAFGQNSVLTPLIDGRQPLIQTTRRADGSYAFAYARFDRWLRTFDRLGFRWFMGHHIWMLPNEWYYDGVYVLDEASGQTVPLMKARDDEAWLAFIPVFYRSLYSHLKAGGWLERYIQHQLDEPKDSQTYARLAALAHEHLPGVRTMDAINSAPDDYSPSVDIQVFAIQILGKRQDLAAARRAAGQGVWLYHCCSPYPPYPNRHLDERLTDSRLYPWLAYLLNADGYLNWAANVYRGADPYRTSVGPVPGGSQNPGHPPGDNWFYYPGPHGLRSSLRQVAFRDGLLDHALLKQLAAKDRPAADRVMGLIARSLTDYETAPEAFHTARTELLDALENGP